MTRAWRVTPKIRAGRSAELSVGVQKMQPSDLGASMYCIRQGAHRTCIPSSRQPRSSATESSPHAGIFLCRGCVFPRESLCLGLLVIDPQTQFFADLEERHLFGGHRYHGAGSRVASFTSWTLFDDKAAKPANLDPLSLRQGVGHTVKDRVDDHLSISP